MLLFAVPSPGWAQNTDKGKENFLFGHPIIYNHSSKNYNAGSQIWDIEVAHGRIFFANNEGLLVYDGISWKNFPTPNSTIVRSLFKGPKGKIYTGAQGELGYYELKKEGNIEYVDMTSRVGIPQNELSEIWNIFLLDSALCFSSGQSLYHVDNKLKVVSAQNTLECMAQIDSGVWFYENKTGMKMLESDTSAFVFETPFFADKKVVEVLQVKSDSIFILTEKNGIYLSNGQELEKWETNADAFLKENTISCAEFFSDGLVIGTYFGGVAMVDFNGKTNLYLDISNGLQSNNINTIKMAPNGVLWIGTNRGIAEVDLESRKRFFFPDGPLRGSVYDLDVWNGNLFFSSSNGLYYIKEHDYYNPLSDLKFKIVRGTEGQCWGTDIIEGQLFCAHHKGALIVDQNLTARKFSTHQGAWKFVELDPGIIAVGFYYGVSIYKRRGKSLTEILKVPNFEESSRIMVKDKYDNLWVSHPYKSVYRFRFDDAYKAAELRKYSKGEGLKSSNKNYVDLVDSLCFVTNPSGIYRYNNHLDSFEVAKEWNALFGADNYLRRIKQVDNDLWCITDSFTAKIERQAVGVDLSTQIIRFPDINTSKAYIGGFESLFPLYRDRVLIASEEGMIEYLLKEEPDTLYPPELKSVVIGADSIYRLFNNVNGSGEMFFQWEDNDLSFTFDAELPNSNENLKFSYKLDGTDDQWSHWTGDKRIRFNDLGPGRYELRIRSKNSANQASLAETLRFQIYPPWYRSTPAYASYALGIGVALFLLLYWPKKKYQKDREQLLRAKQISDRNLAQIKKEKLLSELEFSKKELANSAFHLVQKQQTIKSLKEKVDEVSKNIEDKEVKARLKEMMGILRADMRIEEDWQNFSFHFDQVHEGFIAKLKNKYPHLSNSDYKLCTYLKMNMSSKDIAPLLNISVRGVELKRYRLRKKLDMDRSEDLNEFLNTQI